MFGLLGTYGYYFTISVIVKLRQSKIAEVLSINQCTHLQSIATVLLLVFGSLIPTVQSAVPTNTFYSFHLHKYVFIPHKLDSTVNVHGVAPQIPRFFRTVELKHGERPKVVHGRHTSTLADNC